MGGNAIWRAAGILAAALLAAAGLLAAGCSDTVGDGGPGAAGDAGLAGDVPLADGAPGEDTAPEDDGAGPADAPAPDPGGGGCVPGTKRCRDLATLEICHTDGATWLEATCPQGTTCSEAQGQCAAPLCKPGQRECVSTTEVRTCALDGSAWGPPEVCPDGRFCEAGFCVTPACFPGVMFLVDRSTSMSSQWQNVQTSITKVIGLNPGVQFGLSAFPDNDGFLAGCSTGAWPHVGIQPDAGPVIDAWFGKNDVAGATPLASAVEWMSEHVQQIWGANATAGHLIVLSDGEDKCRCSLYDDEPQKRAECVSKDLAVYAKALAQQGIRTWVIGYNFTGNPLELDTLAANGGTGLTGHIPVFGEAALTSAFNEILGDIKNCL